MKARLMALILAAVLGITGIAMTAQAQGANTAGTNTTTTCKHETLHYFERFVSATYHDGLRHLSTYETGYKCANCEKEKYTSETTRYESHDYEQIYYRDGKVESTCLDCHDTFYWYG